MTTLADATLPDGLRLYAIGDVHGCLDKLEAVDCAIGADLSARPPQDFRTILIGDYVDRGPDSHGVLAWLRDRGAALRIRALRGNHEALMTAFLAEPEGAAHAVWLGNGGESTLASFGLEPRGAFGGDDVRSRRRLAAALRAALDDDGLSEVLGGLETALPVGGYVFVHAGLRPGLPLEAQDPEDLLWIRDPFLGSSADFGAVVVHGHTPTRHVDLRWNRIGIDTGAVFGGPLTCLVLEGAERWLLAPDGRRPLGEPAGG